MRPYTFLEVHLFIFNFCKNYGKSKKKSKIQRPIEIQVSGIYGYDPQHWMVVNIISRGLKEI